MKQLALALSSPPEPSFDNFVVGRNGELVSLLKALAARASDERFVYVWGAIGSGRSHLMGALYRAARHGTVPAIRLDAHQCAAQIDAIEGEGLVIVDDVDGLDPPSQIALFALYNRIRDSGAGALVTSGGAAPAGLPVRVDLATRLAWGLVYEVRALNDEEKAAAMTAHASARGFRLSAEVQEYVLRHTRRDLPSLLTLVERLDRFSLEERRPITVPLVRTLLRQQGMDEEKQ